MDDVACRAKDCWIHEDDPVVDDWDDAGAGDEVDVVAGWEALVEGDVGGVAEEVVKYAGNIQNSLRREDGGYQHRCLV